MTNSSYPWGEFPERSYFSPRFERVVHVLRSPLDQISSFTAHTNKSYEFVYQQMKHFYNNTPVIKQFDKVIIWDNNYLWIIWISWRRTRTKAIAVEAKAAIYILRP